MAEFADPELLALARVVRGRTQQPIVAAVEPGMARGELPAGTDPLLVLEPIFSTLHFWVAVFGENPDIGFAEQLGDRERHSPRRGGHLGARA